MSDFNSIREVLNWLSAGNKCLAFSDKCTLHMDSRGLVINDKGHDLDITTRDPSDFKKIIEPISITISTCTDEKGRLRLTKAHINWINVKFKDKPKTDVQITIKEV